MHNYHTPDYCWNRHDATDEATSDNTRCRVPPPHGISGRMRARSGLGTAEGFSQDNPARLQAARAQRIGEHPRSERAERGTHREGRTPLQGSRRQLQPGHRVQGRRGHGGGPHHDTGRSGLHVHLHYFVQLRADTIDQVEYGVHDRLHIHSLCGKLYFSWHIHLIEESIMENRVSSERHCRCGVKEIDKVSNARTHAHTHAQARTHARTHTHI